MGNIYYGSMQLSCYLVSASRRSLLFYREGRPRGSLIERKMNLLVVVVVALITLASGDPGLLKVPKVYNAVVTSNQNLSPSRAFPVIQPVIHRTAVGYGLPPVYYTPQVAPHLAAAPEVPRVPQNPLKSNGQPDIQVEPSASVEQSKPTDANDKPEATNPGPEEDKDPKPGSKSKSREQEPLSFYPNYQSLYYDPYFYTYNGFNPHLVPGTYYVDYQPYGTLEPIAATTPKSGLSERLLPAYQEEKKLAANEQKEKIPDVPPPPLPTAVPKSS